MLFLNTSHAVTHTTQLFKLNAISIALGGEMRNHAQRSESSLKADPAVLLTTLCTLRGKIF